VLPDVPTTPLPAETATEPITEEDIELNEEEIIVGM
jgi:hypothetical protein